MFSTSDTIVAIATPTGRGALGIVRLSGPDSATIASRLLNRTRPLAARHATFARITTASLQDQVVATLFQAPQSYTGDDVVEICSHGSSVVLAEILRAAVACGARLAAPGEFTLRAFVNGKIDLVQAEAVADLIEAATPLQARAAFDQLNGTLTSAVLALEEDLFGLIAELEASVDFPEEGYHFAEPESVTRRLREMVDRIDRLLRTAGRGRLVREGARVVLSGLPNAGKSMLFNALVGSHRAIVSSTPGTTRDLLTEVVDLEGLRITLVDTAGLTLSEDPIEQEGVARARHAAEEADLIVHVVDVSVPRSEDRALSSRVSTLNVATKADLPRAWQDPTFIEVSAHTGSAMDAFVEAIVSRITGEDNTKDTPSVSNVRHAELLGKTRLALERALEALELHGTALSEEFLLVDLQEARAFLEEVSGRRASDDLLIHIFSRFCIGK